MKKIIKLLLILVIGGAFFSACEQPESNWNTMTKDYDKNNATYYVQFLNSTASYETAIDAEGNPSDIVETVSVALLGAPQASEITVNLVKDPSSTIEDNMYTLSSNTITIAAGATSGSVTLTTIASEMVEDETVKLVLNMDAGGKEATSATQLVYSLKRIKFCPWAVDDMVGTYSGTDYNGYSQTTSSGKTFTVAKVDDNHIEVSGMGAALYEDIWAEAVTAGDKVKMTVNPNGTLSFENQFLCQTDGVWDYYMGPGGGTAKWDGCTFTFTIPWYWHWDDAYGDDISCESIFTKK